MAETAAVPRKEPPAPTTITVYGADWCLDTRRALRHLRRLGARHRYLNVDEDLDALDAARALSGGERRTPVVDVGLGSRPLIEPDNETLTAAVVEADMLTDDSVREHLSVQNVGDLERAARVAAGTAILGAASVAQQGLRGVLGLFGAALALSGVAGWCPVYQRAGLTSLGGPGDRPAEADRGAWLAVRHATAPAGANEVSR